MPREVICKLRVRYPEIDRMGIAWHGHYLAWFEMGRTEWMREHSIPYRDLEDSRGLFFPVVQVEANYHASAQYDQWLQVNTTLEWVRGARVRFGYRIESEGDGQLLATGATMHASVNAAGRPIRIPGDLRALFEERVHG